MSAKLAGKRKRSEGAVYLASARPYKRQYKPAPYRGSGELKFHDQEIDDAIIAAGGVLTTSINLIAQGTGESERIGRKCTVRQIMWRGTVSLPEGELQGNPGDGERFRLILYQDKQANGAAATALGILEVVGVDNYRNLANSGRFNILYDHRFDLSFLTLSHFAVNSFSVCGVNRKFSFMKKCNIPLEFDSTVGALTELRSNNLGVLLISEGGSGGIASSVRLRFSDH